MLLTRDRSQRIGANGFETFTDSPFFVPINFEALERKELEPVFRPSSDKTNFDATYDLEELLLEEAPLEARARRQKPREQLKVDATREEIRADELHRMIEKLFEPFDYTIAQYDQPRNSETESASASQTGTVTSPTDWSSRSRLSNPDATAPSPTPGIGEPIGTFDHIQTPLAANLQKSRSESPKGSPPLPIVDIAGKDPPRSTPGGDYFAESTGTLQQAESRPQSRPHSSRSLSKTRRGLRSQKGETTSDSSIPDVPPLPTSKDASQAPRTSRAEEADKRPSGMLAFLSRKKGRDRSPRSKERGVLGKEGARVVIAP
jgi:serine/threonine kinase 32